MIDRSIATTVLLLSGLLVHADEPGDSTVPPAGIRATNGPKCDREQDHPLLPCLELARAGNARIAQEIRNYTCVLEKRERINGRLSETERIFAKVRHEQSTDGQVTPFGVYMKFLEPTSLAGREVLFVKESDESKLLVRNGGKRFAFLTVSVDPTSRMAMLGNRYPITEFGIKRLVERMIDLGTKELAYGECEAEIRTNLTLADHDRPCTCVEVVHPIKRDHFKYHVAKIYIDESLQVPIRFESYGWPTGADDRAVLQEEYIYRDLKLNVALADEEFEADYSSYKFH